MAVGLPRFNERRGRHGRLGAVIHAGARTVFLAIGGSTVLQGGRPVPHARLQPLLRQIGRRTRRHPGDPLLAPGDVTVVRLDAEVTVARGTDALLVGASRRARGDGRAALFARVLLREETSRESARGT